MIPTVQAYDFSVVAPSGQTLYFNRLSDNTVEVTYEYGSGPYYTTSPTGDLVIPATVTFNDVTYNVIRIRSYAFCDCSDLTSVIIPSSVTTIGSNAFSDCSSLTSVTIPSSVTTIGSMAFSYCWRLASVTIPNGVTSIVNETFYGVRHIEYHGTATGAPWGAYTINGVTDGGFVYADESKTELIAYIGNATEVTIPSIVTSIGYRAFSYCTSLTSVSIPSTVTSIGEEAFAYCRSLASVVIPDGVTSIGTRAFSEVRHIEYHGTATGDRWGASTMNGVIDGDFVYADENRTELIAYIGTAMEVTIPSSVTTIGNRAFSYCTSLTSVTIPDGVTSIGDNAFSGCSSLTSVTIPSSVTTIGNGAFSFCTSLTSVTIPDGVTSIGNSAFSECSSLTSVTIPSSVTAIGGYAFSYCSSLTSVTILDGVTSIGGGAFSDCSSLTSVTIPSSVTTIGSMAFSYCSMLTEIHSMSFEPPSVEHPSYIIGGSGRYNISLYVPCNAISIYQTTPEWKRFNNIQGEMEYTVSIADSYHGSVAIVQPTCEDNTATLTATADEDFYFDHWSDGSIDNPHIITVISDTTLSAYFMKLVHDTIRISNNYYQYDTTIVNIYDTVINNYYQYDTTIVNIYDTVINNYYQYDTTMVNNQYYDTVFVTNYYHDTVIVNNYVYDTIYLNRYIFDTVYIHDTVFVDQTGINGVETVNAKIYQRDGRIVVEGADGNMVTLYDVTGRILATKQDYGKPLHFDIPASGTYMIKIGNYQARKVVVIR